MFRSGRETAACWSSSMIFHLSDVLDSNFGPVFFNCELPIRNHRTHIFRFKIIESKVLFVLGRGTMKFCYKSNQISEKSCRETFVTPNKVMVRLQHFNQYCLDLNMNSEKSVVVEVTSPDSLLAALHLNLRVAA